MFGLGKRTFLDRDLDEWHFETWAWLMRNLGGMARLKMTPLAVPNRDFFPPTEAVGHAKVEHIFACVKQVMGMTDWECELQAAKRPPAGARVGEYWFLNSGGASGTFQFNEQGFPLIKYADDLTDSPHALVPTLAHELSHYLMRNTQDPPPGGDAAEELATELCVAYAGFGVFGANNAFAFQQHQDAFGQGWSSRRNGYISERTWALAIATFLALKDAEGAADKWLKANVLGMTKEAAKYLKRRPELLAPLRALP